MSCPDAPSRCHTADQGLVLVGSPNEGIPTPWHILRWGRSGSRQGVDYEPYGSELDVTQGCLGGPAL
eukprot:354389-Pyramimonas_sp.AAC.1